MNMKIITLFILLIGFSEPAFCQDNIIKLGSEVTFQLSKDKNNGYSYTIISNKPIDSIISLNNNFLKDDVDSNQVKIVFGKGKFGDQDQTFLIIKSGLSVNLQYAAKIKFAGTDIFKDVSVNPVFKNVKSMEAWPNNDMTEIIIDDFKESDY